MLIKLFLLSKIRNCLFKITIKYLITPISMLFIHSYKTNFFSFIVFLLCNDEHLEYIQCYKTDDNQRAQRLYNCKLL